ncbi:hypothetical protein GCM10010211_41740 [Streptomyces albospinus]|uniref:Uncharacterized protein n=1 Tax=Streptomyces albospinus TaxID=285515 RepID=A0ABQ2V8U0_9ACTN|nr:hypothetical protein GCM10010211_41740 [Streptomyces albospinus]
MLAVYGIGFLQGACFHFVVLAQGGVHGYAAFAPLPLRVFFACLLVLDPLIAVLVGLARPAGVPLEGGVMVLDAAANWLVNWPQVRDDPAWLLRPVGLLPITLFCLFVLATQVPLLRVIKGNGPRRGGGDPSSTAVHNRRTGPRSPA